MRDQIASELRKLTTTRSAYAMLGGLLAIVTLGVVAIVTDGRGADLAAPLQEQSFLHVALSLAPVFALLLGVRAFTDEFRFGSIVPTLLASPNRRRVLGAKLVTVAAGGLVLASAATAVSIAVGVPLLIGKGVEITWSASALAEVAGRLLGATALWTSIGVGLGLAVRHQVAAVAGTLIWVLAGEGLLSGLVPSVARYFPGEAGFAVVGINPADVLSPGLGALVLGGYALVAIAAGGAMMRRRDIT